MALEIPRLNGVIAALEARYPAFVTFSRCDPEMAIELASSAHDGVVIEMEHGPYDVRALRDYLQYLLNRRQILERHSLAPALTPLVRIPPNGEEANQWIAKQVLDLGAYGIVWPHVSTVEAARNAVAACRYPRPKSAPAYEPAGLRGDAPFTAARYFGLTPTEYYPRADVWPLNPSGELLVVIMVEEVRAIDNLPHMLREVPGIGVVLVGEGDLSQDLGHPRDYDHPVVAEAVTRIVDTCVEHGVVCGHPHVTADNVERVLAQGFRMLMPGSTRSYAALDRGRAVAARA
jgi:4-hydroxy-2-oxoheptanedioate aldolase